MKKRLLILTLLTASTLASCGTKPAKRKCTSFYCSNNVDSLGCEKGKLYGLNGTSKAPAQDNGRDYILNMYTINALDEDIIFADIEEFIKFSQDFGLPVNIHDSFASDGMLTLYGEGNEVKFNVDKNRIEFSDYLSFINGNDLENPLRVAAMASRETDAHYLWIEDEKYDGPTKEVFNLNEYGLKIYQYYNEEEDKLQFFLPYSVLLEMFFMSGNTSAYADYRGVFYIYTPEQIENDRGQLTDLGKFMAEVKTDEYSKEYATFNYNALCLSMDMSYGLGYMWGCTNGFDEWVEEKGLKSNLLSTKPKVFSNALNEVTDKLMNDGHSSFYTSSPYCGFSMTSYGYGSKVIDLSRQIYTSQYYRENYVKNFQPYMENGDTAYISFDEFHYNNEDCYSWNTRVTNSDASTYQLISYANRQIKRANSPIKNVVLDMSCNGGGELDSFVFTISWMLGSCKATINDPISGSKGYCNYIADVNFDGKYDDDDNVSDLNLYLLEGPGTFSGGNYTACYLKNSGRVTILGQNSGGGSNCVLQRVSANGCLYQISGRYEMCVEKNGKYINTNNGAEPDVKLSYDKIHNRDYLQANYIK